MSDLNSILANTLLPETASLNNSQTLIASGNTFNSGGFTEAAGTQETLKAFGNYRTYKNAIRNSQGKLITRGRDLPGLTYVPPSNIKAIYREGIGLVPNKDAIAARLDERFFNLSELQLIIQPTADQALDGFYHAGMILTNSGEVVYIVQSVSTGSSIWHVKADKYDVLKNPPPLIGQTAPAVTKKAETTAKPNPASGQKPGTPAKSDVPLLGGFVVSSQEILASTLPAAANKPGAPSADIAAAVSDTPVFKLNEKFDPAANFFRIIYADAGSNIKSFVFTFLPARETKIGNWNVPEARTGVPIQTKMRHKMQVVPGAGPIVQTIGINGTTVTLVGALLGNEVIAEDFATGGPNSKPIYSTSNKFQGTNTYAEGAYPGALPSGAYDKAVELQRRLVYPGRPVTIEIKPSNTQATFQMKADGSTNKIGDFIRMTGVITAIRLQHAHSDRCYYALDLFVTDYPDAPAAKLNANTITVVQQFKQPKNEEIDYVKLKAKMTPAQKAQLKQILDISPKDKRDVLEKNYLKYIIQPKSSLDTRLGIAEGSNYAQQLATANPEAGSEASVIAADYLTSTPSNQAPVGLSIASLSEQLSNNVQAAATPESVLSAISNATAGTLRPAQQKAALEQIATRIDLDPTQLSYLSAAISRYALWPALLSWLLLPAVLDLNKYSVLF